MWIKVGYHANTCAASQFVYEHQGLSERYSKRIIMNFESVVRSCENNRNQIDTHCSEAGSVLQYDFAQNVRGVRPLSLTCCGGTGHENAKCEALIAKEGFISSMQIPPNIPSLWQSVICCLCEFGQMGMVC